MRVYGVIRSVFWSRGSGKRLRGNPEAQVLTMYLMTCAQGTMCGIFNIAIPTIAHETGLQPERIAELLGDETVREIVQYDHDEELCWVPNSAREQLGDFLKPGDTKRKSIPRELRQFRSHRFACEFLELYGEAYGIDPVDVGVVLPDHGAASPIDAPSVPHTGSSDGVSIPRDQHQLRPRSGSDPEEVTSEPTRLPARRSDAERIPIGLRCRLALRNPHDADHASPGQWPEVRAVAEGFHAAMGFRPPRLGGMGDSGVRAIVERFAEGYTQDEFERAVAAAPSQPMFQAPGKPKGLASLTAEVVRRLVDGIPKVPTADPEATRKAKLEAEAEERRKRLLEESRRSA